MTKSNKSRGPGWYGETERHRDVQLARFNQGDNGPPGAKGQPDPRLTDPGMVEKGSPGSGPSFSEVIQANIDRQNRRARKNREAMEEAMARANARRGGPDPNAPPGTINIMDLLDDDPKPAPKKPPRKKKNGQGDSGPKKPKTKDKDRIGTCHSCKRAKCVHPRKRKMNPDNGCTQWSSKSESSKAPAKKPKKPKKKGKGDDRNKPLVLHLKDKKGKYQT